MRYAISALAVLTAFGLAACGDQLDASSIEKDAREGFEAAGVTVDDVSCPSDGDEGETIECTVTIAGGEEVKLPYLVGEENVESTDETIEVITDYAQRAEGGATGGGGAEPAPSPEPKPEEDTKTTPEK